MLTSLIATSFLLSPKITTWQSRSFTVEVNQTTQSISIRNGESAPLMQYAEIESIAYVLSKKDQLSISGRKQGRTFLTNFTPATDLSIRVETSFLAEQNPTASSLLDQFEFPNATPISSQTGPAPKWATPHILYSNGETFIGITPDLSNFNLSAPMPAVLTENAIGYQNAIPTEAGQWQSSTHPRQLNRSTSIAYYVFAGQETPEKPGLQQLLSEFWKREADRRRARAYPQQVPMVIGAYSTFQFRRSPTPESFDPNVPYPAFEGPSRWVTGKVGEETFGYPDDQLDTIHYSTNANALMVAYTMKSWGTAYRQPAWIKHAEELLATTLLGAPESGFAAEIIVTESGPEPITSQTEPASPDEAVTALAAMRWISEFPADQKANELSSRILQTISRFPDSKLEPEFAALIAAASVLPQVTPQIRQAAAEHQVPLIASFSVTPENAKNPSTLETLYWLSILNPSVYAPMAESLINQIILNQKLVDLTPSDSLASFGAFQSETEEVSSMTPQIAALLGRFAIALNRPEWLDRSAFALRSLSAQYQTLSNLDLPVTPQMEPGTASIGFGGLTPGQPNPRVSFESGEGLVNSAIWEVLRLSGGAYTFPDGQIVGVDGLAASNGTIRNSLFSNPSPFNRPFQDPTRTANSSERLKSDEFYGWPSVNSITIQQLNGQWIALATTGLSINSPQKLPIGEFKFGTKIVRATITPEGFQASIPAETTSGPLEFNGKIGDESFSKSLLLPTGSPLSWAIKDIQSWSRTGIYRWLGPSSLISKGNTQFSTGDQGDGKENVTFQGTITSPALTAEGKSLEFDASGMGDCAINLIDIETNALVETWFPTGKNAKVNFNVSALNGRLIQLQITDQDHEGLIRFWNLKLIR